MGKTVSDTRGTSALAAATPVRKKTVWRPDDCVVVRLVIVAKITRVSRGSNQLREMYERRTQRTMPANDAAEPRDG